MTIFIRFIISVILAVIASYLLQLSSSDAATALQPMTIAIIFVACFSAALISPALGKSQGQTSSTKPAARAKPSKASGREQGKVKWFNVSKGYGFVTRETGEDIFVHFRSIQGSGRRVLREGQTIEFSVTDGEKGPQAEDVEAL